MSTPAAEPAPATPATTATTEAPAAVVVTKPMSFAERINSRVAAIPQPSVAAPAPEPPAATTPDDPTPPAATSTETEKPTNNIDDIPETTEDELIEGSVLPIDEEEPSEDPAPAAETKEDRAWGKLKKDYSEANKKITSLESQIQQQESRIKELQGGEDWKAKYEEAEKQLGVVKLESSPAFVKSVTEPLTAVEKRLAAIADEYGIDKPELYKAVSIADKKARAAKISEITSELAPHEVYEVHELGRKADDIYAKEAELIANHDKVLAEIEDEARQAEEQTAAQKAEARRQAVDLVVSRIEKKIPGLKDFLPEIGSTIKETDLDALATDVKVYNAAAGYAVPKLQRQILQLTKDLQEATAEVAALRSSGPSLQTNKTEENTPATTQAKGAMARMAERTKGLLAAG